MSFSVHYQKKLIVIVCHLWVLGIDWKANSNRAFSKLKPLHVLVLGSLLVGEVKSFTVRKAIK